MYLGRTSHPVSFGIFQVEHPPRRVPTEGREHLIAMNTSSSAPDHTIRNLPGLCLAAQACHHWESEARMLRFPANPSRETLVSSPGPELPRRKRRLAGPR